MPPAGYHETYPIQYGTEDLQSHYCYFKGKEFATSGSGREIHKGKIEMRLTSEKLNIVAKVRKGASKKDCQAEVDAQKFTNKIIRETSASIVEVVPTFCAQVQTLSKFDELTTSKDKMHVFKGGFVVIQRQLVGEHVRELWSLDEETSGQEGRTTIQSQLTELAMDIFRLSNEEIAVSAFKGAVVGESPHIDTETRRAARCLLTSVSLHSAKRQFGPRDQGTAGIRAFKAWMKRQEAESCDDVMGSEDSSGPADSSSLSSSFSSSFSSSSLSERLQPTAPPAEDEEEDRQCSELDDFVRRQMAALSEEVDAILRRESCGRGHPLDVALLLKHQHHLLPPGLFEAQLTQMWGKPPPYSP